jgi:hypothetical protein
MSEYWGNEWRVIGKMETEPEMLLTIVKEERKTDSRGSDEKNWIVKKKLCLKMNY